ncbi:MAG: LysM peptidoglycan-binding domain-containing protein [Ilumatobacteraceae bacterium]
MAEKAYLETEGGEHIACLFNPEELAVTVSSGWQESTVPGQGGGTLEYRGGEPGTMSLDLFFDTTDKGSTVAAYTNKLIKLTKIDTTLAGYSQTSNNGRPPWVKFHWGGFHSFRCVIENITVTFVYFAPDGTPLRARASMSLKQFEPDDTWPAQNPTSGTPNPSASHQVQPGENLSLIAAQYYGDATKWRPIAAGNGIADPFHLRPGSILDIPQLES